MKINCTTPSTLTQIRKAMGQSLMAFALRLGISRNTLSQYERGIMPIPRYIKYAALYIQSINETRPS